MIEQRQWKLNNDPYANIPQERMNTIAKAIKNEDANAIYDLFSQTAKDNGISAEELAKLIDLLKLDIDKLHDERCPGQTKENNYGIQRIDLSFVASISVDEKKYLLNFGECVRDDTNEEAVGLTWLVVFPADSDSFPKVPDTGLYVIQ